MTADQYRAIRDKLRLTQQELADRLGVHKITIAKREGGSLPISRESELAIQSLLKSRHARATDR